MSITYLKRKVRWGEKAAHIDFGDGDAQKLEWVSSRWVRQENGQTLEGENFALRWDGLFVEEFSSELEIKLYLIRLGYGIEIQYLIPSELLADAGLRYMTGDWVDEFTCTDKNDEIGELQENHLLSVPKDRRIRLPGPTSAVTPAPRAAALTEFLRLQRGRDGAKSTLLPVTAEKVVYVKGERVRTKPIDPNWEDPSPFSRVFAPLWRGFFPKKLPSDDACTYRLRVSSPVPKRKLRAARKA